jgi:hypothetical protein
MRITIYFNDGTVESFVAVDEGTISQDEEWIIWEVQSTGEIVSYPKDNIKKVVEKP